MKTRRGPVPVRAGHRSRRSRLHCRRAAVTGGLILSIHENPAGPGIHVPTIITHRTDNVAVDVEGGRELAALIPNARYVELPGTDHIPFVGDNAEEIADAIEEFLNGSRTSQAFTPAKSKLRTTLCCLQNVRSMSHYSRRQKQCHSRNH
jgi:pimeloyl-ACP methyl ester carboxylesterase